MGCSLQKKIKEMREKQNRGIYINLEQVLKELGVVAQKIREIFAEDMFNKMNKEQDQRLDAKKSGYFPYYVVEAWLNDLQKEVLGLLVEGDE